MSRPRARRGPVTAAQRLTGAFRDGAAGGGDRDLAGQVLGLVHAVRGEQDGLAEAGEVLDHVHASRRA
jgi:hypothetical protein